MEAENGLLAMHITNAFEPIFRRMLAIVGNGQPPESGIYKSSTKVDPINAASANDNERMTQVVAA